ncbi:glycosyltransferase family 2 protein [Planctomicrobium sp. SH668]|uniref:glycosyltransferase family 2 protein n=1 Tax=Planctomicrobium sp. SH668 TaxID=3448126 RepID=UPI003F5BE1EA
MLSIVIPVFNEEESLQELHRQIRQLGAESKLEIEVIFVDDGSTDSSWSEIETISRADQQVRGIRFRRNFGKASALTAGLKEARGELMMMMDADLQDDPAEIPQFIQKLHEGFDVVNGWKQRRLDPWHKVYPSKVFNWMVSRMTGVPLSDHNCGIKLFRSEVARELRLYGELHRFIPVLAASRGFRIGEVPVNHRSRQFGHSKYGFKRFLRGFLDLLTVSFLTTFAHRPLHMFGGLGLAFFALGSLGLTYLAGSWVLMNVFHFWPTHPIVSRPLLIYSVAAQLLGAQAMSVGILAELIVANASHNRSPYSIRETTAETSLSKSN